MYLEDANESRTLQAHDCDHNSWLLTLRLLCCTSSADKRDSLDLSGLGPYWLCGIAQSDRPRPLRLQNLLAINMSFRLSRKGLGVTRKALRYSSVWTLQCRYGIAEAHCLSGILPKRGCPSPTGR